MTLRYFPLIGLMLFSVLAMAQPPNMDTVLYGASYYHEYMPYERLEQDVQLMQKAGISVMRLVGPDQQLPSPVRTQQGVNSQGKTLRYWMNFSGTPQTFNYPYAGGTDILSGKTVAKAQSLALPPWDLIIVKED